VELPAEPVEPELVEPEPVELGLLELGLLELGLVELPAELVEPELVTLPELEPRPLFWRELLVREPPSLFWPTLWTFWRRSFLKPPAFWSRPFLPISLPLAWPRNLLLSRQ